MAIFGNGNTALLHQLLRELGELRKQVTSQQQSIEQLRLEATGAISSGLNETRAVVRDGLERHRDTIGDPLARLDTDLVSIRAAINDLAGHLPQAQPAPDQAVDDGDEQRPAEKDIEILRAAAGISAATLHAHRDTWEFLVKHASQDRHFHLPAAATPDEGAVAVAVSGPTLVATLTSLADVKDDPTVPHGTAAIAHHLHKRITDTVKEIVKNPHMGDPADPVSIVIDDRAKPETTEE